MSPQSATRNWRPGGNNKPLTPMPLSPQHRLQLRGWQAGFNKTHVFDIRMICFIMFHLYCKTSMFPFLDDEAMKSRRFVRFVGERQS